MFQFVALFFFLFTFVHIFDAHSSAQHRAQSLGRALLAIFSFNVLRVHRVYICRVENDKCTSSFYFHRFIFYEKQFVISSMMKPLTCSRPDSLIERTRHSSRVCFNLLLYITHIHASPMLEFFLLLLLHLLSLIHSVSFILRCVTVLKHRFHKL